MARTKRKYCRSSLNHVMGRGNAGQNIFFTPDTYFYFYSLLDDAVTRYACRIHAFCLMTNHVHLVVETNIIPLNKIMQSIFSRYAAYFNHYTNRKGHVFQGRFKSEVIDSDQYLCNVCAYIHLNPIEANLVSSLNDYPWSSHHAYSNKHSQELTWVTKDYVLQVLHNEFGDIDDVYNFFIENHPTDPEQIGLKNEATVTYKRSVVQKLVEKHKSFEFLNLGLEQIIEVVCESLHLDAKNISDGSHGKKRVTARSLIAYFAHYYAHFFIKDIAMRLNRDPTTISRSLHLCVKNFQQDAQLYRMVEFIKRKLFSVAVSAASPENR